MMYEIYNLTFATNINVIRINDIFMYEAFARLVVLCDTFTYTTGVNDV